MKKFNATAMNMMMMIGTNVVAVSKLFADGMMRRRITESGATNDLPTSIKVFGTALTPSHVLMQIGNTDSRKMIATLTLKPSPSHSTSSGTSATSGMA